MTRARTPSRMLWVRGFSVCWATACSVSSSGMPEFTRVASWRVTSASSVAEKPRRSPTDNCRADSFSATSETSRGTSARSRRSWRTCRAVSPSRTPFFSLPALSSATYSKAPTWPVPGGSVGPRDPEYLLQGGHAGEDLGATVVAEARAEITGVFHQLVFAGTVVDHRSHVLVHGHQFVDAGAATKTPVLHVAGPVNGRRVVGVGLEHPAFVLPGGVGHLGIVVEHAHQTLGQHADEAGGQQEWLDAHVAQAGHRAHGRVGVQGREHEVAGQRCLHGDLGRLQV